MDQEARRPVLEALEALGIELDVEDHEQASTLEEIEALGLTSHGLVAKNLFLRDEKGKRHFLVMIPGTKHPDLKRMQDRIGCTRLSFGSDERLMRCLGLTPGRVSPFGILNDAAKKVELFIDKALAGAPRLGFHPNDNTAILWLSWDDLMKFIKARGRTVRQIDL